MTVASLQVQRSSLVASCSTLRSRSRSLEGTQQEWWLPWKRARKLRKVLSPCPSVLSQSRIAVTSWYSPVTSLVSPTKCGCYLKHLNSSRMEICALVGLPGKCWKTRQGKEGVVWEDGVFKERQYLEEISSVSLWSWINIVRKWFATEFKALLCCFVVLACPCALGYLTFCHQLKFDL